MQNLLSVFGTAEAFRETWLRLKDLPMEFHNLNLISGFRKLTKALEHQARAVLAVSDIFAGQNELTYGHTAIHENFRALLRECSRFSQMIVSGKDPRGRPFIGFAPQVLQDIQARYPSIDPMGKDQF